MKRIVLTIFTILLLVVEARVVFSAGHWVPLEGEDNKSFAQFALFDIYFTDRNNGWIVGAEYGDERSILHTSDGGKTWQRQSKISQRAHYLFANRGVHFSDSQNGWIVGDEGVIFHTSTGGVVWQKQESGLGPLNIRGVKMPIDLFDVHVVDNNSGWAVGGLGAIIHTENVITWERQSSGTTEILWGISCVDKDNCWAVGSRGTILYTSNGGKKKLGLFSGWKKQESGTAAHLYGVHFIDKDNGWVVGAGGVSHTTDGGKNWQTQARFKKTDLHKVFFLNKNKGWAVGTDLNNRTGAIVYTEDGGKTWLSQPSGTMYDLTSVYFISEDVGFAVGGNGTILRYVGGN